MLQDAADRMEGHAESPAYPSLQEFDRPFTGNTCTACRSRCRQKGAWA